VRKPLGLLGLLALIAGLAGCSEAEYSYEQVPSMLQSVTPPYSYGPYQVSSYLMGVGDTLAIQSYSDASLKQTVTVRPDGKISLILLGDVNVLGRTTEDLDRELKEKYSILPARPDVIVNVEQIAGLQVYVGGEVKSPSVQEIKGSLTLLQSISAAGGFLPTANPTQVLILRQDPSGRFHAFQHDVDQVLHNESGEIYLKRHDIVFVPKTKIAVADQYVEQYVNQIIPRSVGLNFGYNFFNQVGNGSSVQLTK
jgi:polysaccharide export outer membrane protein